MLSDVFQELTTFSQSIRSFKPSSAYHSPSQMVEVQYCDLAACRLVCGCKVRYIPSEEYIRGSIIDCQRRQCVQMEEGEARFVEYHRKRGVSTKEKSSAQLSREMLLHISALENSVVRSTSSELDYRLSHRGPE